MSARRGRGRRPKLHGVSQPGSERRLPVLERAALGAMKVCKGLVTDEERYNNILRIWNNAKADISKVIIDTVDKQSTLFTIVDSGARGAWHQITQIAGMKGLVANPAGKTIELPIKSNFIEGFEVLEYFIATHGGKHHR